MFGLYENGSESSQVGFIYNWAADWRGCYLAAVVQGSRAGTLLLNNNKLFLCMGGGIIEK
jgi:hypothetical protein